MKTVLYVCAFVAAGAVASAAHADGTQMYVGAGIGKATTNANAGTLSWNLTQRGYTSNGASVSGADRGWRAFFGADFNDYVGAEIGYADLGDIETHAVALGVSSPSAFLADLADLQPVAPSGYTLDVLGKYEFGESGFSIFGRAGTFFWNSEVNYTLPTQYIVSKKSGVDAHIGLGVRADIGDHWGGRLEWEKFDSNTHVEMITFSVMYRF